LFTTKNLKMKPILALTILAVSISAAAPAMADTYPSKPITIVVPYPPGGSADIVPRALGPKITEALGVPVIVENRPGAGGSIGAAYVAKSNPDGYTLLMGTTGVFSINQFLYKNLIYSPEKDLAPIINTARAPNVLVVHPSVPARNLAELIALAKSKPKQLTYASQGNGSTGHMCGELLNMAAGIQIEHIPYKGSAPAMQDLIGGQVPLMCENFSNAIPHVRANRLRALAVTSAKRSPQAPDIPTAQEAGLPGFEASVWYGLAAPAGTPKAIIDKLNAVIAKALHAKDVTERLSGLGLTVVGDTPEQFATFIHAESAKWRKVVQVSGATVD
jgi:tripartite-type tricarboxylate transporter receptor subunit TctC